MFFLKQVEVKCFSFPYDFSPGGLEWIFAPIQWSQVETIPSSTKKKTFWQREWGDHKEYQHIVVVAVVEDPTPAACTHENKMRCSFCFCHVISKEILVVILFFLRLKRPFLLFLTWKLSSLHMSNREQQTRFIVDKTHPRARSRSIQRFPELLHRQFFSADWYCNHEIIRENRWVTLYPNKKKTNAKSSDKQN